MNAIHKAQERAAKIAALQSLIDEAEDSGPSTLSQAELLSSARLLLAASPVPRGPLGPPSNIAG
jgi:hypothetical protein